MLKNILLISQLVLAILIVVAVLFQQQGSGLGAGFGGSANGVRITRRGPEKIVFNATIVISILFFVVSLLVVLL